MSGSNCRQLEAKVDKREVLGWIDEIGKSSSASVPLLQAIQSKYGYLPRKAMDLIVANSEISGSQLYGVATFYSQFRLKPVGRHIVKVCHGTACHVRGADRLNTAVRHALKLEEGQDTNSTGAYTMEDVACVGCCSVAPVMVIDEDVHGDLSGAAAARELKKHARKCNEEY